MQSYDRISGPKITDFVAQLIKDQTLVKVYLAQSDFEHLTVILEARNIDNTPSFRIDPPKGLWSAIQRHESDGLSFEFTGFDKLTHRFEAKFSSRDSEDIWLAYPDHIQRYQLRSNFRIKVPQGAQSIMHIEDSQVRMRIDNVSLGGVFCHCRNAHKDLLKELKGYVQLVLVIVLEGESHQLTIDKANVIRMESIARPKYFGVAFEFVRTKISAQRRLTQLIYDLQRVYLKNRLKIDS